MSHASIEQLKDRARMLQETRSFFQDRSVMEVDCCSLLRFPSLDAHVEAIEVAVTRSETGYLHTSPEFAMKRLLAEGSGDLYYLGHVFRKGDFGRLHNPEFAMIEWYRVGKSYLEFIREACSLIELFLGELPVRFLSYRDAYLKHAGIDPFAEFAVPCEFADLGSLDWKREEWLHFLMSAAIEPHLGKDELTVLCEYPPGQAGLSRIVESQGNRVAERFEIYHRGVELCNGYHELTDSLEQRRRFEEENSSRQSKGLKPYPLDEAFLASITSLPDCCGASIGFDRLMFLRNNLPSIHETLVFSWRGSCKTIEEG